MYSTKLGYISNLGACCIFFFVFSLGVYQCPPIKQYNVEITFCDNREKVVTVVYNRWYPLSSDIHTPTFEQPYYSYNGYYNVCSIRVISSVLK